MGLFDKVKNAVDTAQNVAGKVQAVSDKFSSRGTMIENDEAEKVLEKILLEDEEIKRSYKGLRDLIVFTDKRVIKVDIQGVTGKKKEYFSIPYRAISRFSIETAGSFDMDSELKIYGSSNLIAEFEFGKSESIFEVQSYLAKIILWKG